MQSRSRQRGPGEGLLFFFVVLFQAAPASNWCVRGGGKGGVAMAKGDLQGMNSLLFLPRNEWVAKTSPHMKTRRCYVWWQKPRTISSPPPHHHSFTFYTGLLIQLNLITHTKKKVIWSAD